MSQIKVFSKDGIRLGSTSKAFDTIVSEELMREFTLKFSVANTDSIFKYIAPDTVYECEGERFDVTNIDIDTTGVNVTSVNAEHVSYRLNNYNVPANYAFVGTVKEIGADILKVSGADAEFIMGDCSDVGTQSFTLNNDKEVTARAAIIALKSIGVEIQFSNFVINLPERIGVVKEMPLVLSRRSWQKNNGWTYSVDIADTGNVAVGDTYPIVSDGLELGTTKRIITHERHLDDPTQNSVTLGVFVRDEASAAVEVDAKLDNSLQQGEQYNNVSINHTEGFKSETADGLQRVIMNAFDGFAIQIKENGVWKNVNSLELFGLLIERLTSQEAKNKFYVTVGKLDNDEYGLKFMRNTGDGDEEFLSIYTQFDKSSTLMNPVIKSSGMIHFISPQGITITDENGNSPNFTGQITVITKILDNGGVEFGVIGVQDGLITDCR